MTRDVYKQYCEEASEYRVLENQKGNLEDANIYRGYISKHVTYALDDDLIEKIYCLTESVINEQISRLEKKMEEL